MAIKIGSTELVPSPENLELLKKHLIICQEKFRTGEWVRPSEWGSRYDTAYTFPHLSRKDQSLIAHIPSARHAAEHRPQQIKPGKYLQKFFPSLKSNDISKLTQGFRTYELQITTNPDEVEKIYNDTAVRSCMTGGGRNARIWVGSGRIGLAYIRRKDRLTARALVDLRDKIFWTVYGEDLAQLLLDNGFKKGAPRLPVVLGKDHPWRDGIGWSFSVGGKEFALMGRPYMPHCDFSYRNAGWDKNGNYMLTDVSLKDLSFITTGAYRDIVPICSACLTQIADTAWYADDRLWHKGCLGGKEAQPVIVERIVRK